MSHSPHRDGLLSCIMNTPVSKGDSINILLFFYKVIPFHRTSCSISNGSKTPPLTYIFVRCVCLQTLLLLMPPSIRARMMAAVYLPPGVWPYSVQWRRHRIMWTLRPVSSRHMSPCSPGWATPPLLLRPCPPAYHLWSPLHRAASQQIGPDNCRHVSPLNLKQGCSEVRSCTKGESKQQSLNCYIHFYNIYLK